MHHNGNEDPSFNSKSRSTWEVLSRVAHYLKPYKALAAATIACAVLSLAFSLAYPKLTQYVIDEVIGHKRAELLTPTMLGLLGAFLLRDVFNGLRVWVNNTFEQNVIYDIRCEVYARLQRLPAGYFDQRASGDLMTRVLEDVNSMERVLIDGTEQGTVAVLSVTAVTLIMFLTNPVLAGVALVPLPILSGGALWYTLTAHRRYRRQRVASSAMNALLMDNLQGVRQIKAFGREDHEDKRFAARASDLRAGTLGVMRVWAAYSPAMSFAGALGLGLVLWVGGRQVLADRLTIGQLVGFMFYLGLFYEPISRLHGLNQMMQAARASGERVFDILDAPVERPKAAAQQQLQGPVRGEVRYENVSFAYSPDRVVLKSISLHARPGEMIALAGPTGAGKTTLVNLLPAFYEATGGRILIDNQDISLVSLSSLREQISVVSQEAFLFNGTVRENILYGRLKASEEELRAASQAANCHDFIMRLPNGYDSRVGERGVKLSVGEKQRVSIARALLKNAPILILDEATASVDTATERLIQEALERLIANRTSFVIAHRLSHDPQSGPNPGDAAWRNYRARHSRPIAEPEGLYNRLARIQGTTFIEESFEQLEASAG